MPHTDTARLSPQSLTGMFRVNAQNSTSVFADSILSTRAYRGRLGLASVLGLFHREMTDKRRRRSNYEKSCLLRTSSYRQDCHTWPR